MASAAAGARPSLSRRASAFGPRRPGAPLADTLTRLRVDVPALPPGAVLGAAGFESAGFESAALESLASGAAGLASLASALTSAFDSSLSAPRRLRLLSFLKSVSYQPPPLRRNAGADTSFFRVRLPHDGQRVNGASVIFCMTSV